MLFKNRIKSYLKGKNIYVLLYFLRNVTFFRISGGKKKYPKVIQLPLTYACNAKCIMCNIWKMDYSNEVDLEEFSIFLKDPLFKEVTAVGINGGEPSLIRGLPKFAEEICKLPKLTSLNIITHGFNNRLILKYIKEIYEICQKYEKSFHVSISLDGYKEIHDSVRGKNVFNKTFDTILEIKNNQSSYCDSFDLGCTVVKQNVDYLVELDCFLKTHELDHKIKYRLGIDNKRIESDQLRDQYSVIFEKLDHGYSSVRQSAKEFFFGRISKSKLINDKFKYFALFNWLNASNPKRLLGCHWKDEGVTMDARGKLYYCAVESDEIGDLRSSESGEASFFSDININYRQSIVKDKCDECIHDYDGDIHWTSSYVFLKEMFIRRFSMQVYRFKVLFL